MSNVSENLDADGMTVESGLHRVPAFYRELLVLMNAAGIDLDEALVREHEAEICVPDGPSAVYTLSLPRYPLRTLAIFLDATGSVHYQNASR